MRLRLLLRLIRLLLRLLRLRPRLLLRLLRLLLSLLRLFLEPHLGIALIPRFGSGLRRCFRFGERGDSEADSEVNISEIKL